MKKLKPLPKGKKSKGLRKLPKPVRNKMGFMKKGGKVRYTLQLMLICMLQKFVRAKLELVQRMVVSLHEVVAK